MRITVTVTADDIACGIPRDYRRCALGLALARHLNVTRDEELAVGTYTLRLRGRLLRLPPELSDLVAAFDQGKPVKPGSYYVDLPDGDEGGHDDD